MFADGVGRPGTSYNKKQKLFFDWIHQTAIFRLVKNDNCHRFNLPGASCLKSRVQYLLSLYTAFYVLLRCCSWSTLGEVIMRVILLLVAARRQQKFYGFYLFIFCNEIGRQELSPHLSGQRSLHPEPPQWTWIYGADFDGSISLFI